MSKLAPKVSLNDLPDSQYPFVDPEWGVMTGEDQYSNYGMRLLYHPEDALGIVALDDLEGVSDDAPIEAALVTRRIVAFALRFESDYPQEVAELVTEEGIEGVLEYGTPEEEQTDEERDPEAEEGELRDVYEPLSEAEADVSLGRVLALLDVKIFAARRVVKLPEETYERALAKIQKDAQEQIDRLLGNVRRGNAPADTIERIGRVLRMSALDAATLGKLELTGDGEAIALTATQRANVDAWHADQMKYLRGVYLKVRRTIDAYPVKKGATPEEKRKRDQDSAEAKERLYNTLKNWRLPLYVNALRANYERARARWALSKYPRSGDTSCLMNCLCSIKWELVAGEWIAHWILGAPSTEHCEDCPRLAKHSPYKEGEL